METIFTISVSMTTLDDLQALHIATSWYIVGVVTMVELHTYPNLRWLRAVPVETWQQAHKEHCRAMGIIIGGPMVLQLVTGVAWWWLLPNAASLLALVLIIVTWALTFGLAVPQHQRLSHGYNDTTQSLRRTNRYVGLGYPRRTRRPYVHACTSDYRITNTAPGSWASCLVQTRPSP